MESLASGQRRSLRGKWRKKDKNVSANHPGKNTALFFFNDKNDILTRMKKKKSEIITGFHITSIFTGKRKTLFDSSAVF